jgi:hypothetical protein
MQARVTCNSTTAQTGITALAGEPLLWSHAQSHVALGRSRLAVAAFDDKAWRLSVFKTP